MNADLVSILLMALAIGGPIAAVWFAMWLARRSLERADYQMNEARCAAERERQLSRP